MGIVNGDEGLRWMRWNISTVGVWWLWWCFDVIEAWEKVVVVVAVLESNLFLCLILYSYPQWTGWTINILYSV